MQLTTKRPRRLGSRILSAGLMMLGLAACAAEIKPFEYTEIHEIPPGRGAFTGMLGSEQGEFVLYNSIDDPADVPEPPDLPTAN
jgi:hypothetical protein